MIIDFDDFGANKVISPECQSHDCRDKLDELHFANMNLKVTLFTIPAYMTMELADWCDSNRSWIELAVHGYNHSSNWECAEMSYEEFDQKMRKVLAKWPDVFVKGFKAPGWQISDDIYRWLQDNGWWVADQDYNNGRRLNGLWSYVHSYNKFIVIPPIDYQFASMHYVDAWHGHTWDCVGNGIYERFNELKGLVEKADNFQFISEALQ